MQNDQPLCTTAYNNHLKIRVISLSVDYWFGKVYKKDTTLTILIIISQGILTLKIQSFDADTDSALLDHTAVMAENTLTLGNTSKYFF